jgi:1-phosphatidylinositol-4-phosphate 5-kinase
MEPGFGNPILGTRNGSRGNSSITRPPPTPPKTGYGFNGQQKPESADSGYAVGSNGGSNGRLKSLTGSQKSQNVRPSISRDSLDKALPPLPKGGSPLTQNVS